MKNMALKKMSIRVKLLLLMITPILVIMFLSRMMYEKSDLK
jgi:hypothetical protein